MNKEYLNNFLPSAFLLYSIFLIFQEELWHLIWMGTWDKLNCCKCCLVGQTGISPIEHPPPSPHPPKKKGLIMRKTLNLLGVFNFILNFYLVQPGHRIFRLFQFGPWLQFLLSYDNRVITWLAYVTSGCLYDKRNWHKSIKFKQLKFHGK